MRFCMYLERKLSSNRNMFIIKFADKMKHVPCELYLSVSHTVFEVKKSDRVRIVALRIQFQTRYFSVSDQNTTTQVRVIHSMGDI